MGWISAEAWQGRREGCCIQESLDLLVLKMQPGSDLEHPNPAALERGLHWEVLVGQAAVRGWRMRVWLDRPAYPSQELMGCRVQCWEVALGEAGLQRGGLVPSPGVGL